MVSYKENERVISKEGEREEKRIGKKADKTKVYGGG